MTWPAAARSAAYVRPRYALDTGTAIVTGLHIAEPKGPYSTSPYMISVPSNIHTLITNTKIIKEKDEDKY